MEEIAIEYRNSNELTRYENNPRDRSVGQIDAIASSIAEYGFNVPLVINAEGVVIAGHGRLEAARQLGLEEVPVIVKDSLSPSQQQAYRLADNKIAAGSSFLAEKLASELQELEDQSFDLLKTGFTQVEIDELMESMDREIEEQVENLPEDNQNIDEEQLIAKKHKCPNCDFEW